MDTGQAEKQSSSWLGETNGEGGERARIGDYSLYRALLEREKTPADRHLPAS